MSPDAILGALLSLLIAVISTFGVIAARNANRAHQQDIKAQTAAATAAVDAGAYARAREIYEGALTTLRSDLASTRQEIHELRTSNDQLRSEATALRVSNTRLQSEITLLRGEIEDLRRVEEQRGS